MTEHYSRFQEYTAEQVLAALRPDDLRAVIEHQDRADMTVDEFVSKPFPRDVAQNYDGIPPEFRSNTAEFDDITEEAIALDSLLADIRKFRQRRLSATEGDRAMEALRIRRATIAARMALRAKASEASPITSKRLDHAHSRRVASRTPTAA